MSNRIYVGRAKAANAEIKGNRLGLRNESVCIYFDPDCIVSFNTPQYNLFALFKGDKTNAVIKISDNYDVRSCFERICEWNETDLPEKEAMMLSLLVQLIIKMNGTGGERNAARPRDNGKINDIINYIDLNFTRKITLGELEKEFFINKYYLCHLFKDTTGLTVSKYISQKKVALAKELLKENYSPVSVCAQIGFDDYSNFYRMFKKATGMAPGDYIRHALDTKTLENPM